MRPVRLFRSFAAAFLTVLVTSAAFAFPPHNQRRHDARAEVEKIDAQWRNAEMSNDTTAMDRILSDDYLGITAGGQVVTKAQELDRMRNRDNVIRRADMSDVKIRLKGRIAIVTSLADLEGTMNGHPVHGMFRSMRVYQRLPGATWKLTSFEATRIHAHHRDGEQSSTALDEEQPDQQ